RTCGNCANVKCRPINPGHGAASYFLLFIIRKIARGAVIYNPSICSRGDVAPVYRKRRENALCCLQKIVVRTKRGRALRYCDFNGQLTNASMPLVNTRRNNPKFSEDLGVGVGKTVKFLRSSGWHIWANPEWRMIFPKQVENDGNAAPRRNRKQ
ncbi:hypothetical protein ALC56_12239, partial [Trachymyrmex septentrionalis]